MFVISDGKNQYYGRLVLRPKPKVYDYSNASRFIDVHQFDGQLRDIFFEQKPISYDQKISLFHEFMKKLNNDQAKNSVQLIINDSKQNNNQLYSNVQPDNNLDASEILAQILLLNYSELFDFLQEQLSDITQLGICNSGRCTRLLSIWKSLVSKTHIYTREKTEANIIVHQIGNHVWLDSLDKELLESMLIGLKPEDDYDAHLTFNGFKLLRSE